jgi:hypothetical protein
MWESLHLVPLAVRSIGKRMPRFLLKRHYSADKLIKQMTVSKPDVPFYVIRDQGAVEITFGLFTAIFPMQVVCAQMELHSNSRYIATIETAKHYEISPKEGASIHLKKDLTDKQVNRVVPGASMQLKGNITLKTSFTEFDYPFIFSCVPTICNSSL